jgi:hypothetical protein
MAKQYSEPTRDIVLVIILLVVACILLGISLAGVFFWLH